MISLPNFNDTVPTTDPYEMDYLFVPILIGFPNLLVLFVIVSTLYAVKKEIKLITHGKVTTGTIIAQEEYRAGKAGYCTRLIYGFTDDMGKTISGQRDSLPSKAAMKTNPKELEKVTVYLDDPIVIYDPEDSNKNLLYPGIYTQCLPARNPFIA